MERSKQSAIAIIVCIAVSALCSAAPSKIIYVDDDANGLGDGSSWIDAYRYLQDALADANDSAKPVEVHVAQGTYKPDQGAGIGVGDYKATFQLINGVALRGGYAGPGEADPNVRDVKLYESVLSGDLGGDDPDVNDPRDLIHEVGWNSRTVVTGSGTDNTAVLDGFVITGGRFHVPIAKVIPGQPPRFKGSGAGMNNHQGSPAVIACTFTRNRTNGVGAGMCNVEGSHPKVIDCVFTANLGAYAGTVGTGMVNWYDCHPTVTGCVFTGNVAWGSGAGVYNRSSSPTFEACTFSANSADLGSGGAMANEQSTCTMTHCAFTENYSRSGGGAIYIVSDSNLTFEQCMFTGNRSEGPGGAMYGGADSSLALSHCIFKRNASPRSAGGALCLYSQTQLSNCTFSGNLCYNRGGAVFIPGATFTHCLFTGNRTLLAPPSGLGGAVYAERGIEPLRFINCTLVENQANYISTVFTGKSKEFRNCILRGPNLLNWADPWEPQPHIVYCDVEHAWPGEGNIDVDPLFAKPGFWANADDPNRPGDPNDPNTVWVDGDYHLKSQAGRWDPKGLRWVADHVTSPCIDAGDPNTPVGEEPEPNGGRINMGAYGGTAEASKSYSDEL